jgi:gamma-glutamyltranspeptidase
MPVPELAGHAHAILVTEGGLEAAADPRADGVAVGLD